jgi:hypothetical protein
MPINWPNGKDFAAAMVMKEAGLPCEDASGGRRAPQTRRLTGLLGNPPERVITCAAIRSASPTKDVFSTCVSP